LEAIARNVSSTLPEEVWDRIRRHPRRLLVLDFDGTLAPFEVDRMAVRVPEASRQALEDILHRDRDQVAFVSGRPIAELSRLLDGFATPLAGEHGWEERSASGVLVQHTPSFPSRLLLHVAETIVRVMGLGDRLEVKRASIVLHTRGVTSASVRRRVARCARMLRSLFVHDHMWLDAIHGGFELRERTRTKGTAVAGLIERAGPGVLPVYFGDDATDEDAFAVVRPVGITVRVGEDAATTRAEWALDSPDAVSDFLCRWAEMRP